jgi:hypothetical protein
MASERTWSAHAGSTAGTAGIILISIVLREINGRANFWGFTGKPGQGETGQGGPPRRTVGLRCQSGQTDSQVKFLSSGDGYWLFRTSMEVVFKLCTPAGIKAPSVFRIELLGAGRNARVSGADKLPGVANYFIGNDPKKRRSGISAYGKVGYRGIYPGVGAVFCGNWSMISWSPRARTPGRFRLGSLA